MWCVAARSGPWPTLIVRARLHDPCGQLGREQALRGTPLDGHPQAHRLFAREFGVPVAVVVVHTVKVVTRAYLGRNGGFGVVDLAATVIPILKHPHRLRDEALIFTEINSHLLVTLVHPFAPVMV